MLQLKRIYEPPATSDGYRILVDRLWPRGISKERAALDLWLKEIAPSPELRTWFGHRTERFAEFRTRYLDELTHNDAAVQQLRQIINVNPVVTLLYAAKDPQINHAVVLQQHLASSPKK